MKLFFTRSDIHDCLFAGVQRCTVWLQKPTYVALPMEAEDSLFPASPQGWRVRDEFGVPVGQVSCPVGKLLDDNADVVQALFGALVVSIDGVADQTGCYDRWNALIDHVGYEDHGQATFLLEMDVSPSLWWKLARHMSNLTVAHVEHWRLIHDEGPPF